VITAHASRGARARATIDGLVAIAAFALTLVDLNWRNSSTRHLDALGVALAALACFPLVLRRREPLAVFAFTTAASATLNGLGYSLGPPFGPTFALYFVALDPRTRDRLRQTALVILALFALHVGVTAIGHSGSATSAILFGVVVWGAAWIVGDQVRQRRQRLSELLERARLAELETARERRLAAAEERTRIARDLHDSAAHAINVILVQAGAARLLQNREPERVTDALSTIEEVARETIGEIDQLIRGLRDSDTARNGHPMVEPPTGVAALPTLAARHRAAGQAVDLCVTGASRPLARSVDQAAYRIVQEALTNAARHGAGGARVELTYGEQALEITVSNPLATFAADDAALAAGHGILGMQERATLIGGAFDAGPLGERFRVRVTLPYAPHPGQLR
jgi:signal transduction histidine kinase